MQPQPVGDNQNHDHNNMESTSLKRPAAALIHVADDDGDIGISRAVSPDAGPSSLTGGQYSGPTSSYTFLRKAWKRFSHDENGLSRAAPSEPISSADVSIFAFGDRVPPEVKVDDFCLPDRTTTTSLMDQYFDLAMPTYRFFHQQTILQWLEDFYRQEQVGADQEIISPVRQVRPTPRRRRSRTDVSRSIGSGAHDTGYILGLQYHEPRSPDAQHSWRCVA